MKGRLNFIFNTHLPFVRHPEYPKFLEEDWLFEAINESYLPLLRMLYNLKDKGTHLRLTFSLSPALCEMLEDSLLKERFEQYLLSRIELGEKEVERLEDHKELDLAKMYLENLKSNYSFYTDVCDKSITKAFNSLEKEGLVELITTCATHAYLPVYQEYPVAVNAQVEMGIMNHATRFDKSPDGFWLPECGFYPGLEKYLKRHNISWISLGAQSLILGDSIPKKGTYAPVKTPDGLYCFARDYFMTSLVWSQDGYPSDPLYRDFYRDIGYDLPIDYVKPYIHEPEVRVFTGFKYYAVTGKTSDKVLYNPAPAMDRALTHAKNFLYNIKNRTNTVFDITKEDPVFTLSFDTELFGHWWYEGVKWLEDVITLCSNDNELELITSSDYIKENHNVQTMMPGFSSWGEHGYSEVWVDSASNAWLCRHTLKAVERMQEIAQRFPDQTSLKKRFLNQAARETLLLMSSDWPCIIHNHSSEGYAKNRIVSHIQNLNLVYEEVSKNAVNTEWLVKAEKRNKIFADIDYNIFNSQHLSQTSPVFTKDFAAK